MLGYWIQISPLTPDELDAISGRKRPTLADWETGITGLDWLELLVNNGNATKLKGDGYPSRYISYGRHVFPFVLAYTSGETNCRNVSIDLGDGTKYLGKNDWISKARVDGTMFRSFSIDRLITIDVWDLS